MVIFINIFKFLVKKIIYASFLIYGYNFIAINFNLLLPINFFSMLFISCFGWIGLVGLVLFKYLIL